MNLFGRTPPPKPPRSLPITIGRPMGPGQGPIQTQFGTPIGPGQGPMQGPRPTPNITIALKRLGDAIKSNRENIKKLIDEINIIIVKIKEQINLIKNLLPRISDNSERDALQKQLDEAIITINEYANMLGQDPNIGELEKIRNELGMILGDLVEINKTANFNINGVTRGGKRKKRTIKRKAMKKAMNHNKTKAKKHRILRKSSSIFSILFKK